MSCFPWLCIHLSRELAQITIPAGLISQADGEAIRDLLRKGPVSVALNWTDLMPKASKVEPEPYRPCYDDFTYSVLLQPSRQQSA